MTGTRGIPYMQGGVETHCEELFPRLARLNYEIIIVRRSCYVPDNDKLSEFKGVKLKTLFTVRRKTIETLFHTFMAIIWARSQKADIIHIHAIGPALLTPFARFLGLKVVFTHHGPDYDRAKWGRFAKFILRSGEKYGTLYANEVIVISEAIKKSLSEKFNRNDTELIYNGVTPPVLSNGSEYLQALGLKSRHYVFTLGRFVEEKGFDLLINAFNQLDNKDYRLVIAGDADHEISYTRKLKKLAKENNVVLPGFIKGEELHQLFSHAGLFVLPSFHEGLPISLLEAMSYRLPVLVSDIPANRLKQLSDVNLFRTGDMESLASCLKKKLNGEYEPVKYNMSSYNWDNIALQTDEVYKKIMAGNDRQ